jgi:Putative beta-barrel porin 2
MVRAVPFVQQLRAVTSVSLLAYSALAASAPTDNKDPTIYATEQYAYDNNLYRLPTQFGTDVIGANLSREDHVNSILVGATDELRLGAQSLDLAIEVSNNRFARNRDLNNTSGTGTLTWDWRFSPLLSGDAGGEFHRALAGFANTRFLGRDLVDTGEYFADAQLRFAAHWRFNGGLRNSDTTHSLADRQADNFRSRSANAGIEYLLSETDSIGFDYLYADAAFPHLIEVSGEPFNRSYQDSRGKLFLKYAPTGKTTLDAAVGYLRRRYPDGKFGSFSGNTWRASLQWQISGKTRLVATAWRELTAYLDSESDYFVSRGQTLSPT